MNSEEDVPSQDNESGRDSPPRIPMDSPGSSVSSRLQEEYSQLLKYTVESTPGLKTLSHLLESNNRSGNALTNDMEASTMRNGPCQVSAVVTVDTNEMQSQETSTKTQAAVDMRMAAMGDKLDGLLGKLKENILEELLSSLMASLDSQHDEHKKSTLELHTEKASLQKEVNRLTEQINSLECCLKQKSTVVKNLTDSLAAQKKKVEMARNFFSWKSGHSDKQREIFTEKIAVEHHERKLNLRVLKAWYGLIQNRWRGHVERKCQSQAQSMCLELTNDYEAKISTLNSKISSLEGKVSSLQAEREMYSENVKKAFMRGMCALNMETMSLFGEEQQKQQTTFGNGGGGYSALIEEMSSDSITDNLETDRSKSLPEASTNLSPSSVVPSRPCPPQSNAQTSQQHPHSTGSNVSCKESKPPKLRSKSAKSPGSGHTKLVFPSQILAPPMASVVVERHPPVNKKTLGKATAVQYPKKKPVQVTKINGSKDNKGSSLMQFKPLAGQDSRDIFFKVVE